MTKLLNYSTEVPVSRTVGVVQGLLVEAGARRIASEYDDVGRLTGLSFVVETYFGPRLFVMPVNADKVHAVLVSTKPVIAAKYRTPEHAERVAWRIIKDWLEAQLAIIRTNMVTLDQIMLPFLADDQGRTVYELYVSSQLALGPGSDVD